MEALLWSARVKSVRKDVECAFGRLKGRFRILKLPLRFHKIEDIDNIVFTCATLHNMIAMDDGLDRRWESDVTWEGADGLHGDALVDDDVPDDVDIERVQSVHGRPVRAGDDYSAVGMVSVYSFASSNKKLRSGSLLSKGVSFLASDFNNSFSDGNVLKKPQLLQGCVARRMGFEILQGKCLRIGRRERARYSCDKLIR